MPQAHDDSIREQERERCAAAIEAMMTPESGADYGMASDERRRQIRSHNSTLRAAAACVRAA